MSSLNILKILLFLVLGITVTRIVRNNMFLIVSVHKSSQVKLLSDFIQNICKGVICFQWIFTTVFCKSLFQATFFFKTLLGGYFHFYLRGHSYITYPPPPLPPCYVTFFTYFELIPVFSTS